MNGLRERFQMHSYTHFALIKIKSALYALHKIVPFRGTHSGQISSTTNRRHAHVCFKLKRHESRRMHWLWLITVCGCFFFYKIANKVTFDFFLFAAFFFFFALFFLILAFLFLFSFAFLFVFGTISFKTHKRLEIDQNEAKKEQKEKAFSRLLEHLLSLALLFQAFAFFFFFFL
jgi:hypothetical protein